VKVVVTGGAGFIGSNLVDRLLEDGHQVVALDNLSTGHPQFLQDALRQRGFSLVEGDLLDESIVESTLAGADAVVHLAANADVRFGWDHPRRDLEQNAMATQNVLEAMRRNGVRRILFASTGSVYGETDVIPTPEDAPFPLQTSLYGASKLAAEGLIQAYSEAGEVDATVFRFVSILGPRYTHGHVIDFVRQLREDPGHLKILGDGTQRKSYLYVDDCVAAICARLSVQVPMEVMNLGLDAFVTVKDSADRICARLNVCPEFEFSGGDRGWIGDNPFILLDVSRIESVGWIARTPLLEAVDATVDWLMANEWVFDQVS